MNAKIECGSLRIHFFPPQQTVLSPRFRIAPSLAHGSTSPRRKRPLDRRPSRPDLGNLIRIRDIDQRIRLQEQKIGPHPRLDDAPIREVEVARRQRRRSAQYIFIG